MFSEVGGASGRATGDADGTAVLATLDARSRATKRARLTRLDPPTSGTYSGVPEPRLKKQSRFVATMRFWRKD